MHTNTFNFTYSKQNHLSTIPTPQTCSFFCIFSQDCHLPLNGPRHSSITPPPRSPMCIRTAYPSHSNSQEILQTITSLLPHSCLPSVGRQALSRSTDNSPWQVFMFLVLSDLFLHHSLGSFLKSPASLLWLPVQSLSRTSAVPTLAELGVKAKRPATVLEVPCDPALTWTSPAALSTITQFSRCCTFKCSHVWKLGPAPYHSCEVQEASDLGSNH